MRVKISLSLFVMVMIAGCYKEPLYEELSSNFTVTTNRDTQVNFSAYKTFYVSDTVSFKSSTSQDSILVGADAKALVNAVKTNLTARGYTFVPKSSHPDLGINMGVLKDVDVGVIYPGWWYGYPGWWGGGYWGWGYPYYYPWGIPYAVTSGNVIVDMVDLKNAAPKKKLEIIWAAFTGGGTSTTTSVNVERSLDAINQAFTQSPYIKTN